MPFWDRFWWLRLLSALLVLLSAIVIPVRTLAVLFSLRKPDRPNLVDFASAAGLLLAGTAAAAWMARSAEPARMRRDRRLAALAGNQEGMPRLYMPNTSNTSNISTPHGPLFIYWRSPWYHRFITSVLYCAVALLIISLLTLLLLAYLLALVPNASRSHMQIVVQFPLPLMIFLFWCVYFCSIVLYGALTTLAGRTAGVEVTQQGVLARGHWGPPTFVSWKDARLLEVSGSWRDPVFRLYGSSAVARWSNQAIALPARYSSKIAVSRAVGSQDDDVQATFQAICAEIVAHTSLAPRSLSQDLLNWYGHPPSSAKDSRPRRRQMALTRRARAQMELRRRSQDAS